ncbi:MAG TPA: ABC transporter permease [Spirochaetota bacterium]|nr:ABC transporter permease [Spirochaetota bacterium]HOD16035.1 ABC transporter permease [Spirochaetota bacterium]HPG51019.1 ABC transporter permease [Spirochaetota bacterium]HPN10938.1 ABC transporter permease [Spirochaetota bacterium]
MKSQISHVEITLGWRNVWKNRRRTVLTLLTIMVGCAMIIFMKSVQKGAFGKMVEDAVAANTGHIQVHEKGYRENTSIDYALLPDNRLEEALRSAETIASYSMRVNAAGFVASGNTTEGAAIQAVDPERERTVTDLHTHVLPGGRYLRKEDSKSIVMGEVLAGNLGVKVGDTISMISQGFDGSVAAASLTVVGLFRTRNPEYDNNLVIMPLAQAMETFTMMGYVNSVAIRLKDGMTMEETRDLLRRSLGTEKLEIMGWDELMPDMVQFIDMKHFGTYIFEFILFTIVAFGVMNTIQMSVYERVREFGIMMAIGTRPEKIRRMVAAESFMIALMGVLLGSMLGSALALYFTCHPLDYSSLAGQMKVWGVSITTFPARLEASNILNTSGIMLAVCILFTIIPARYASRLRPIEAIRKL